MNRSYYKNSISNFINEDKNSILGQLSLNHTNRQLEDLQKNAWVKQIEILKDQLKGFEGQIYFEFAIPRMGKRVDNIIIVNDSIFVVEFKVGDGGFESYAQAQVLDYTLDLKHFHEGSHNARLIPVLVATNAKHKEIKHEQIIDHNSVAKTNKENLNYTLESFLKEPKYLIDCDSWERSIYKPTTHNY